MPLVDLDVPILEEELPADAERLIREADRRIAEFQNERCLPAFVASDFVGAYRILRNLSEGVLIRGRRFCEWGSGFGVVTALAAMLEFEACGIEVEGILVEEARRLADDFGLPVEFAHGSFVPPGAEERVYARGTYSWLTTEGDYAYDELGLEPADMDVIFAYPWPDEEAVVGVLFEHYAGPGAVLATFHGGSDFRLRRKVARRNGRGGSRNSR
ncbi:MAG: hypothetical protein L0241_21635 [Planctomycetia bacterium]|nr:hypothetical protein [Planctomycetia bacterium]